METDLSRLERFLIEHPELEVFEIILPDLNGRQRGKWVTRDKITKLFKGGVKLPISALAFDVWGRDPEGWVFDTGDGDGICVGDIRTLVPVPWLPRATGQIIITVNELDGQPAAYDGRAILSKLMQRFDKLGYTPVLASEMEFYLFEQGFDPDGSPIHSQSSPTEHAGQTYGIDMMQDMSTFMHGVRDACAIQQLPIDTLIKEAAPSQYEINLYHQADALLASDQALMLQRAIKGVANEHQMRATFMAKPFANLAGNGMHMHCSLIDAEGNNVFNNQTDEGSDLLRHAIAGCLDVMAECMLIFAPHQNSYRRFQRGSHAPLAPTWGYENRTVSIRVPADAHEAMRIEHRVAGADANPYLVTAAILAGMLHGIEKQLVCPDYTEGNAYDKHEPSLPRYWPDALNQFKSSQFIKEYFGDTFQEVFAVTKQQEVDEFDHYINALEYQSYL